MHEITEKDTIVEIATIIINLIFCLALTSTVAVNALGLYSKERDGMTRRLLYALVFALMQGALAFVGSLLGNLVMYMLDGVGTYVVFVMMLIVSGRMILDSIKIVRGKKLFAYSAGWGVLLVALLSSFNTFLMSLTTSFYQPFGDIFYLVIFALSFGWAMATMHVAYSKETFKWTSFLEFSAAVFILVISVLYLFTDLV